MKNYQTSLSIILSYSLLLGGCINTSSTPKKDLSNKTSGDAKEELFQIAEEEDVVVNKPSAMLPQSSPRKELKKRSPKKGGGIGGQTKSFLSGATMDLSAPASSMGTPSAMEFNTERYDYISENDFKNTSDDSLSTFSIDVDTASYANLRRFIKQGSLPPKDAVRIEEMINYFKYDYPSPKSNRPFSVHAEVAPSPWAPKNKLLRIGIKAKDIDWSKRPSSNLVFLLDVSGSMSSPNKLPLLKKSLELMLDELGENDRVAIVVYAGAAGVVLNSTTADNKEKILDALESLNAGGSTNGGAGIKKAYQIAQANYIKGGINRVILATDGDFNVGTSDTGSLVRLVKEKAKSNVFLSVLGFGMGNYNDAMMEKISGKGNGNYAYIDTLHEAKKVLVEELGGTMLTVAKDVKIQVEFNPQTVASYRLIGYENRKLAHQDFNNDKKDAGEIGSGHNVTAFYEIVPTGSSSSKSNVDPLKYKSIESKGNFSNELATVKLRYKKPAGTKSVLARYTVEDNGKSFDSATNDFRFAASVATFGMLLRDSKYAKGATYKMAINLAKESQGKDAKGYRSELLELIKKAGKIKR